MGVLSFITGPVGRWVVGGAAVVALLFGVRSHYIGIGKEAGSKQAQQDDAKTIEQSRQDARKQAEGAIADANDKVAAADAKAASADANASQAIQAVKAIVNQRNHETAKIKGLLDSQLHDYIVNKLGIRAPADHTPGYLSTEEREIATRVEDAPSLRAEAQQHAKDLDAVNAKVDALGEKIAAMDERYRALGAYTSTVEADYVVLYNAQANKGNKFLRFITAGLAGKPKTIPVPDPKTLFQQKENTK